MVYTLRRNHSLMKHKARTPEYCPALAACCFMPEDRLVSKYRLDRSTFRTTERVKINAKSESLSNHSSRSWKERSRGPVRKERESPRSRPLRLLRPHVHPATCTVCRASVENRLTTTPIIDFCITYHHIRPYKHGKDNASRSPRKIS